MLFSAGRSQIQFYGQQILSLLQFHSPDMNDNEELLLNDSPPGTPVRTQMPQQDDDLLLDDTNEEQTTANNPLSFTEKLNKTALETWSCTQDFKNSINFLQSESSSDQEEIQPLNLIYPPKVNQKDQQKVTGNFKYASLVKKLEKALKMIQSKQKSQRPMLLASVKPVRPVSSIMNELQKPLQTHRPSKGIEIDQTRKKRASTKYQKAKKCITQPDENINLSPKKRSKHTNLNLYNTNKIIKQVEQKDSPLLKKKRENDKLRTKQQFLASMTNWQQRRKLRQEELAEREKIQSMSGVTFVPQINAKSKRLMKNRGDGLPIFQRLLKAGTPKNGCQIHK